MKKLTLILIALFAANISYAQSTSKEHQKFLKASLHQVAGLLKIEKAEVDTKEKTIETHAKITEKIRHLQNQNERKTETLEKIVRIFGERETGIKAKDVKNMKALHKANLIQKMEKIRDDAQMAVILKARVKELEKKLKAAQRK